MLVSIRKLNSSQKEDLQKLINASDGNEEICRKTLDYLMDYIKDG